jgi:hypothetical protein
MGCACCGTGYCRISRPPAEFFSTQT